METRRIKAIGYLLPCGEKSIRISFKGRKGYASEFSMSPLNFQTISGFYLEPQEYITLTINAGKKRKKRK